jgi:hypothetical protein
VVIDQIEGALSVALHRQQVGPIDIRGYGGPRRRVLLYDLRQRAVAVNQVPRVDAVESLADAVARGVVLVGDDIVAGRIVDVGAVKPVVRFRLV